MTADLADLDHALELIRHDGGHFTATVPDAWCIKGRAHGGYLAALVERACHRAVDRIDVGVRSLTVHYLRSVAPGPVDIVVTVEHSGRSLATTSFRVRQHDSTMLAGIASFAPPTGSLAYRAPDLRVEIDPPERTPRSLEVAYVPREFLELVDIRLAPNWPLFARRPDAHIGGWARLATSRPADVATLLVLCDSFPRALMATQAAPPPVAPPTTMLHFLLHERALASCVGLDGFIRVELLTKRVSTGFFDEDSLLWSADGTLLAQARQLAINIE